MNLISKNF